MGSGRDKRKAAKEKKAGPAVGKGTEKTERKTKQNEVCLTHVLASMMLCCARCEAASDSPHTSVAGSAL